MADAPDYKKPIPIPDQVSQPFFAGARQHRLMLQRCSACGAAYWPVKSRCPACLSAEMTWVQASGRATLYSFALMHQLYHPGFAAEVPYNVAEVDLEEGPRIISNIVGCSNAALRIGMPLQVTFEDITDTVSLPKFRPASAPPE